eukprot:gene11383-biopygen806
MDAETETETLDGKETGTRTDAEIETGTMRHGAEVMGGE